VSVGAGAVFPGESARRLLCWRADLARHAQPVLAVTGHDQAELIPAFWRRPDQRQTSHAGRFQKENAIKHHSNHSFINCGIVR
jgi:hypothetical protein